MIRTTNYGTPTLFLFTPLAPSYSRERAVVVGVLNFIET